MVRVITAGFLHFGAVHLVNNMVILYCMGSRLERVTGHLKYFLIYLVSLIGAGLLSYGMMLRTGDYAVSAGASGAIFRSDWRIPVDRDTAPGQI